MEIKFFIKKPLVIANLIILFCFLFLPYISMNFGFLGSFTKTGIGLFFTIFDKFSFLNTLLILVPLANAFIIYKVYKNEESLLWIFKVVVLAIHFILFMYVAFLAEKSSIKFVGFGLWLSLIVSVLQMFDTFIFNIILKQFPDTSVKQE